MSRDNRKSASRGMLILSHERDHERGNTMTRITVPLTIEERQALAQMASQELRDPRAQIKWLLREEAERRGIWPPAPNMSEVQLCAT